MAEPPSSSHAPPPPPPPPPPPTPPSAPDNPDPTQYWCYQCDKRVPIETLPGQADVICFECKSGFVELISVHHPAARELHEEDQLAFGNEFLQVLRLIAMAAREDDAPPLPPPDRNGEADENDYLRIELDGWAQNDDDDDEDDNDDDDVSDDNNEEDEEEVENPNQVDQAHDRSEDNHHENENEQPIVEPEADDEDLRRRHQRDVIRLRLRDFATRALSRRHRLLDWAEILTGLEDHSVEFRFQSPGDRYIGNPGDYLDAAGYEALLQTLAESDNGSKRGAPPASNSAVEALPTVKVKLTDVEICESTCAICKDKLVNNEEEVVKKLPCGHLYHEECIVPWLGSRNSCPVCRFELPTDDPEYEEERKKRALAMGMASGASDDAV